MNKNLYPSLRPNSEFWRKRQNVSKRRKRIKTFGKIFIFPFLLFLILFFYAGFTKLEKYIKNSETLKVRDIRIHSKSERIRNEIEREVRGLELGTILFIDSGELTKNIMKNPYVKDVKIKKILPSRVEIFVEEREGIAILKNNSGLFILDENGNLIKRAENLNSLPIIIGASLKDRFAIEIALSFIKDLKGLGYEKLLEEIDVSNPFNINVKMRDSQVKIYLGESEWIEKFRRFLEIKNTLRKEFGNIEYVGFYNKEKAYVKRKNQN